LVIVNTFHHFIVTFCPFFFTFFYY